MDNKSNFSFAGMIVTLITGYLAYKCFQFADGFQQFYDKLNSDETFPKLFLDFFNLNTEERFSDFINFIHYWVWAVFISLFIKFIIAFSHTFEPSKYSIHYYAISGLLLEWAPFFFKTLSVNTFEAAFKTFVIFIPTVICASMLNSSENPASESQ